MVRIFYTILRMLHHSSIAFVMIADDDSEDKKTLTQYQAKFNVAMIDSTSTYHTRANIGGVGRVVIALLRTTTYLSSTLFTVGRVLTELCNLERSFTIRLTTSKDQHITEGGMDCLVNTVYLDVIQGLR